ncbi:50S ribosomal protein L17 [Halothermothrix orenii]|uniref:Large ribosomal subunit protein bL17 n=1 Tax=Halothermothrix orenii (strain H 168 / OCM 544 / DSM 9562) TaxID=373903 RepID=RL17_HALOH|nr:50S ribosomal protein L17 [Halothermothrix orenii]B8D0T8.1 RecName: Full=Large ribosomal subunit protein bL17; AltName: Full=50S ribosomal protein L17 [Halothermothrix orenii H 168]ACL68907.1 ribosomal protein L17 [Halothermothrix orenii H 168]
MPQRKLGKTGAHRKAMFRNMLTDFFRHGRIETTLPKAKELRSLAEKMITTAKTNDLSSRRKVLKYVKDKEVVKKLFDEIAPRYSERPGGYTRILKMYPRRGDAAEKAIIELVEE